MKKVIAIFALATLVSCGGSASSEAAKDSVAAQVDSAAVSANDSAVAQIPADSTATK